MTKYVKVEWPATQLLMDHPRFSECLFVEDLEGHEYVSPSTFMCPEDLYTEIFEQ